MGTDFEERREDDRPSDLSEGHHVPESVRRAPPDGRTPGGNLSARQSAQRGGASWWTEERCAELRKLWDEGLSTAQIAAKMHAPSRNAIIGKAHRLGFAKRKEMAPRMPRDPSIPRQRIRGAAAQRVAARITGSNAKEREHQRSLVRDRELLRVQRMEGEHTPNQKTLMDLDFEKDCRWIVGDHTPALYCGAPKMVAGFDVPTHYCAWHARIAYQPPRARTPYAWRV